MTKKTIQEYKIIVGNEGKEEFIKKVNEAITDGWEPFGGVSVSSIFELLQAMVKCK